MRRIKTLLITHCTIFTLMFFGCASVEETSEQPKQETPSPAVDVTTQHPPMTDTTMTPPVQQVAKKETTVVAPPQQTPVAAPQPTPTGNFTVQIGAFSISEKADKVAELARTRFSGNVYKYYIKDANLFKVYMGDFMTKEDARKFRDRVAQQFPDDYKDAWVAPIPYEK